MVSTRLSRIQSVRVPTRELIRTPYIRVLTYPKISLRTAKSRVKQLEKLKIRNLVFEGKSKIGALGLLGLGTVSVVVKAETDGSICALKIRRTDANRPTMEKEFRLTSLANRIGIGADALGRTKDLMSLRYLNYVELHEWFRGLSGRGRRERARQMIHAILNQCRKLDIIGLDHGELSDLRKHVVAVGDKPYILDFESAGQERSSRNVTSASQYLLIGGRISPLVRRTIGLTDVKKVLNALRAYKREKSDISYSKLLKVLKLVPD